MNHRCRRSLIIPTLLSLTALIASILYGASAGSTSTIDLLTRCLQDWHIARGVLLYVGAYLIATLITILAKVQLDPGKGKTFSLITLYSSLSIQVALLFIIVLFFSGWAAKMSV